MYLGFDRVDRDAWKTPGPVSLWVRVRDIRAVYDRLLELGARPKFPPQEKPWGDVLAAVFDPDGNLLGLSASSSCDSTVRLHISGKFDRVAESAFLHSHGQSWTFYLANGPA